MQIIRGVESESEQEASSSGSEGEGDIRRAYVAAAKTSSGRAWNADVSWSHPEVYPKRGQCTMESPGIRAGPGSSRMKCTYCGSKKHGDIDCWKRLVCDRCGKKGHPADRCLFVCRGFGEVLDVGKCQLEAFYNLIRQWYNPTKHAGQLPEAAEKMLKLGRSPVLNLIRAERSDCCIYAFVEKHPVEKVDKVDELDGSISDLCSSPVAVVANARVSDEFSREELLMTLDLLPGESRGYWKHHAPG